MSIGILGHYRQKKNGFAFPVTLHRRWIVLNKDLQHRLSELHFHKGQRALTPLQHEAFIHFLGDPRE